MASIIIFGFGGYVKFKESNISNQEVSDIHKSYRDDNSVYSIETNYD